MLLLRCERTRCRSPWGWVTRQPPRQATDPNPRILNSRKQTHGSTFYSQKRLRTSLVGAADVPLTHPALKKFSTITSLVYTNMSLGPCHEPMFVRYTRCIEIMGLFFLESEEHRLFWSSKTTQRLS